MLPLAHQRRGPPHREAARAEAAVHGAHRQRREEHLVRVMTQNINTFPKLGTIKQDRMKHEMKKNVSLLHITLFFLLEEC